MSPSGTRTPQQQYANHQLVCCQQEQIIRRKNNNKNFIRIRSKHGNQSFIMTMCVSEIKLPYKENIQLANYLEYKNMMQCGWWFEFFGRIN